MFILTDDLNMTDQVLLMAETVYIHNDNLYNVIEMQHMVEFSEFKTLLYISKFNICTLPIMFSLFMP